jgi:AraC family transcriptional regulator
VGTGSTGLRASSLILLPFILPCCSTNSRHRRNKSTPEARSELFLFQFRQAASRENGARVPAAPATTYKRAGTARLWDADRIAPIGIYFYDQTSIESMPSAKIHANGEYAQRIDRVIDYLRGNLDRPVKLAELADVACFSEFHFHRIFSAVAGETLNHFTNRLRLEKAARLLRYSEQSLTDIALDCGFSSSATFSRAFRSGYDTSPSQFRKSGEIKKSKIRKELFPEDEYGLPMGAGEKRAAFPVRLIDIGERQVAYIRVTNAFDMDKVLAALKKVIEWAKSQDMFSQGILFGMTVDDPHVTPKHLYRYEVCLASSLPFECMPGMSKLKMPAMRYAAIKVSGDIHKVATAWDYLYRDWLINSAYEPEHAPALEVFLDKEGATDWSHFELELCLPVRKAAEMRS